MTNLNQTKGPFLTVEEAATMAGINRATINNYAKRGYLELHHEGGMVYYRDLLRAAWSNTQAHLGHNAGEKHWKNRAK
jgi:hypothetical protein